REALFAFSDFGPARAPRGAAVQRLLCWSQRPSAQSDEFTLKLRDFRVALFIGLRHEDLVVALTLHRWLLRWRLFSVSLYSRCLTQVPNGRCSTDVDELLQAACNQLRATHFEPLRKAVGLVEQSSFD